MMRWTVMSLLVALTLIARPVVAEESIAEDPVAVRIASKKFTESVVLGELARFIAIDAGADADHQKELGGTRVLWNALLAGDIDAYPDYTGTIALEILGGDAAPTVDALRPKLADMGVCITDTFGFNNTYALGMLRENAEAHRVTTISGLRAYPDLKLGFSNEFMDRRDGWPGLREAYNLPQPDVRDIDHDLAYEALATGSIDVIDLYATDAKIQKYDLEILEDDRDYFPRYDAVLLYRADLRTSAPKVAAGWDRLAGAISTRAMVTMNARVEEDHDSEAQVAADYLAKHFDVESIVQADTLIRRLTQRTLEHLSLVGISMGAAILIAIPIGVVAARWRRLGQGVLAVVGIIQTIPALALLVLLMKPLTLVGLPGIGAPPAIAALFLYSLLPMVRNTHAGLCGIETRLRESAAALGLSSGVILRRIELPLASPMILAGIKTAAVINVGFATLGALIGAGGYGQPILTGIRLQDYGLILEGALPAAGLALVVQALFELLERWVVPRGLRLARA